MNRRILVLALAAVLVGLAVGVWLLWRPEPMSDINLENTACIQRGMTLAEVETVLGGPSRREGDGPIEPNYEAFGTVGDLEQHLNAAMRLSSAAALWRSNRAMVWVAFDRNGRVSEVTWCPARFQKQGPLVWLRRWLGW